MTPKLKPTVATAIAATDSQGATDCLPVGRSRLGTDITSAAHSSKAEAKSNSCKALK
jgi:hypothetical protein